MLDISLVVCTRNRAAQLADALPHFARLQSEASWEIVFVDNGSTDASPGLLDAFAKSSGLNIRVVQEPRAGLSVARNAGWRSAGGGVVAFTDDDCYPVAGPHRTTPAVLFRRGSRLSGRTCSALRSGGLPALDPAARPPGGYSTPLLRGDRLHSGRKSGVSSRDPRTARWFRRKARSRPVVWRGGRRYRCTGFSARDHGCLSPGTNRVSSSPALAAGAGETMLAGFDMARGAFYAKMLANRPTRRIYLWPALRRTAGSIWRRDFAVMARGAAWCLEVFRWLGSRSRFSVIPR